MIIERGVNLVWFGRDGARVSAVLLGEPVCAQPRFRLPAATLQFAHAGLLRREP